MREQPEPVSFWRALSTLEYWLLFLGGVCALGNISAWVTVPAVMAGLIASAMPKYIALWPRARALGYVRAWWVTVALSLFNCLAAAVGAHVVGRLTRWLWF